MPHYVLTVFLLVSCFPFSAVPAEAAGPGNAGFERGVNLSHWYSQIMNRADRLHHLRTKITADDMRLIRPLGMDHVRIPVDPDVLRAEGYDGWAEYRGAVELALEHGLNVIVDVHPKEAFKHALRDDRAAHADFVTFWQKLAALFADTDPKRVRFELLNEPTVSSEIWAPLQFRLVAIVRDIVPEHTLILCGAKWSSIDELFGSIATDDPNVVFNFHFYEPHQFTHQAASWGAEHWREIQGLAYPASEQAVQETLAKTQDPRALDDIKRYLEDGWDAEKVHLEVARAAQWAEKHGGLTLTCNEFGVYAKAADPDDRAAWIHDVRDALELHGVGWTMWDYDGGFALLRDGKPDPTVRKALGLKPASR